MTIPALRFILISHKLTYLRIGGKNLRVCRLTNMQINFGTSNWFASYSVLTFNYLHLGEGLQALISYQVLMPCFSPFRTG